MRVPLVVLLFVLLGSLLRSVPASAECLEYSDYLYWTGRAVYAGQRDVAMLGDYAYVIGWNGFHVVDVTDPRNPTRVGYLYGAAVSVCVSEKFAYFTDGSGVTVVDVRIQLEGGLTSDV